MIERAVSICSSHADPAPASKAASASAGHPRDHPALAPPPGHPQVDLPQPGRTAAGQRRDRRARHTAWPSGSLSGGPG